MNRSNNPLSVGDVGFDSTCIEEARGRVPAKTGPLCDIFDDFRCIAYVRYNFIE
jgi:hypothetical protein